MDPLESVKYRIIARAVTRGARWKPGEVVCHLCQEVIEAGAELLEEAYRENRDLERALVRLGERARCPTCGAQDHPGGEGCNGT